MIDCFNKAQEFESHFDEVSGYLVAKSLHTAPFDWDALGDALTLASFEKMGKKVLSPTPLFAYTFFDKYEAFCALSKNNFPTPPTTLINRALLLSDSGSTKVTRNVYREYLLDKLFCHQFPVVIKDRVGVSSFHIEVAKCFGDAKTYILGKRNKVDKVLQPLLRGRHICLEVYAFLKGEFYFAGAAFEMSLNQYGVTSPRFNHKVSVSFPPKEQKTLDALIERFIKTFQAQGVLQFDLILDENDKWWIIEVNTRVGGVTNCTCCAFNRSLDEVFSALIAKKQLFQTHFALEVKLPVMSKEKQKAIKALFPLTLEGKHLTLFTLTQEENKDATQLREQGFCALTIQSTKKLTFLDAEQVECLVKAAVGQGGE